MEEDKI